MTYYSRSSYGGSNPNAGYPANGDYAAWGYFRWPGGVPGSLLGTTSYTNKTNGQVMRVQMRKELVPLWNLIFEIQDRKHHYPVWASQNGQAWGPWGYANRPVAGTQRASGHSSALSVDENAPYNPYSYTWQCDMPPKMVADMESLGLYWGGRYVGQKFDPMHFGFCRAPSTVSNYISKAKQILGQIAPPQPPEEEDVTTDDSVRKIVREELSKFFTKDEVTMDADEMSDPASYKTTRDGMLERGVRLTSIGANRVTGRDGHYAVTKEGGGR